MSQWLTKEEAEKLGLSLLYSFSADGELISIPCGVVTIKEWLTREKQRIERNPLRRAAIVQKSHNSNMLALYVNAPTIWEHEARLLGYSPATEWSTPDDKLLQLGHVEPRSIIKDKYKRAATNEKRVLVVRQDNGDKFAIFQR